MTNCCQLSIDQERAKIAKYLTEVLSMYKETALAEETLSVLSTVLEVCSSDVLSGFYLNNSDANVVVK